MTSVPPTSIISGVDYLVREVSGRPPADDADFDGAQELRVHYAPDGSAVTDEHVLQGIGMVSEGGIFFNEKDARGKDLRRWKIERQDDGPRYVARQGLF